LSRQTGTVYSLLILQARLLGKANVMGLGSAAAGTPGARGDEYAVLPVLVVHASLQSNAATASAGGTGQDRLHCHSVSTSLASLLPAMASSQQGALADLGVHFSLHRLRQSRTFHTLANGPTSGVQLKDRTLYDQLLKSD
jgi:hypothetical protein